MSGAIPPLPNTPSGRGAQFKKGTGTVFIICGPRYDVCVLPEIFQG